MNQPPARSNYDKFLEIISRISEQAKTLRNILNTQGPEALLKYWQKQKENKSLNIKTKPHIYYLVIRPIQRDLNKLTDTVMDSNELAGRSEAMKFLEDIKTGKIKSTDLEETGSNLMMDSLSKGAPGSQIKPRSQHIYAALDNIIIKLASLSQPLGVRPDYGSTGDISERIKKIKEQLKTAACEATMLKMVPPMGDNQEESSQCPCIEDYDEEPTQIPEESPCIEDYDDETAQPSAEGPKVIVIKVDDEPADKAQVVKEGPPCCNECGQPIPAQMGREAHCMEHKFKAIKEMLGKKEIGEAQIKSIRKNLDDIYSKYRALEKETGDD